ncbi:hypothetical protein MUB15_06765 [Priestia sp. OVS21]|nr:hypothetical protein [Priestia sp. OVS21]
MALFGERILEKEKPILKEKRQVHPFSKFLLVLVFLICCKMNIYNISGNIQIKE